MTKTLKRLLLLGLFLINLLNLSASCFSEDKTKILARVISKEDSTQSGTITFEIVIHAEDTVIIDSIGGAFTFFTSISNNGSFPIFMDSSDSTVIQITLIYNTTNLPYFYKSINNYIFSHKDSLYSTHIAPCNIYFTPYNTVEVWNPDDFSGLRRAWILPDSIEPSRVFISRDSIPVSNRIELDSLHEEWEEHFQYAYYPGLPYMVEMKAIHPDTLKFYTMDYDQFYEDSISDPNNIAFTFAKRFKGTVRGRLTSDYINDLNDNVEDRIPLAGIQVILKSRLGAFSSEHGSGNFYTNENGEFEINYDVVKLFDGDEIELFLEFVTESKFGTKVKRKGSGSEENPYVIIIPLGPKEDATLTEDEYELNGDISYPYRIASWTYLAYRFLEDNASDYKPHWDLKIKLYNTSGSYYRPNQRNIYLEPGDERHETVIWHEFGHYIMNFLTGNANKAGGPHTFTQENNFQLAWSEGWATGFMSILDVYYRDLDGESGIYGFFEGGVDPNGTFVGRIEIESRDGTWFEGFNGIRSEYFIACAINDLYDGPNHLSNPNDFNDDEIVNGTGYTDGQIDDLELDINIIFDAMENNPLSVTSFYFFLINQLNCENRSKVFKVFDQNRVRFNGRSLSPDEIGVFESFDDFLTFDSEIWDWINPNLISLNMRLNRDVSIEGGEDFSFNLAPLFTLNGHKFIDHNLNVTNNGILFINDNSSYGWVNGASNGELDGTPVDNSTILVEVCQSKVNVRIGGSLIVGDPNGTNTATMAFNQGSILSTNFNNWTSTSKIIINDNSKLVIEEGAVLEYYPGTEIILNGTNAVLEIKGQLQIMNGATFTVHGGSSGMGFVRFFKDEGSGNVKLVTSPTNDGKFTLDGGSGNTSEILEIDGTDGLYIGSDILEFKVYNGTVLMGENSKLQPEVKTEIYMENVSVEQLNSGVKHRGIYVCGIRNLFVNVNVDGGVQGFKNYHNGVRFNRLNLVDVVIDHCDYGIYSLATGVYFYRGEIKGYTIAGWKSAATYSPSVFYGVTVKNTSGGNEKYGLDIFGNVFSPVSLSYSNIIDNRVGAMTYNIKLNLMRCNSFQNSSFVGAQMEARGFLDMSYYKAFNAFEENQVHFMSRFHGKIAIDEAKVPDDAGYNGFYNQGGLTNPLVFFTSLEPNVQPFVDYTIGTPFIPTANNFYEMNPMNNQTVASTNYFLDERNTRVLGFTRPTKYANLNAWKTDFQTECGYPAPLIVQADPTYKPTESRFIPDRYSTINTVVLNCGSYASQFVVSVCRDLTDSLYFSDNPNYEDIINGLSAVVTCSYSSNAYLTKSLLYDAYGHLLTAYAKGVLSGEIVVEKDSISEPTHTMLTTIDTLLSRADNLLFPWADYKYDITFAKAEVLRLSAKRNDAIALLNGALANFPDSLQQVYINKYICINEAEIAYLDTLVSIDSIYIAYPCFIDTIGFQAISRPLNVEYNSKNSSSDYRVVLYPNPAYSILNIVADKEQFIERIVIYNMTGMVVKTIDLSEKASSYHLNIENINAGHYFIQIITNQNVYERQVVIMR